MGWFWPFGARKVARQQDAEEKSLTGADLERIVFGGNAKDGPFETVGNAGAVKLAKQSSVLWACADAIAGAFAQAPIAVRQPDGDVSNDHPLLIPFRTSPVLSESLLAQYMALHLKLSGVSYLWRFYNARGVTLELLPIPPQMVEPIFAEQTFQGPEQETVLVAGYKVTANGRQFVLPPEDVVVTRYPDPENLAGFFSPARMASRNVEMDRRAEDYQAESLDNLKLPGLVVQTRKPLGEAQKRDLRASIESKIGRRSSGKGLLTLSGDEVKFEAMNPLQGFDWSGVYNLDESRICMALGVPPIVIGARVGLENSPWSNVGEAKRWFYQTTVRGLWSMFGSELTFRLMPTPMRNAGWRFAYDWREIDEMQEAQEARSARAVAQFTAGIITRNEARAAIGMEQVAGGDVFKVGAMDVFQAEDEDPSAVPEQTPEQHLGDAQEIVPGGGGEDMMDEAV